MRKTILVTGASSGIGRATVRYFQQNGWQVAATMRRPELETELTKLANVKVYQLDVQDTDSIKRTVEQVIEDFDTIDVLLNNAGYGTFGAFEAAHEAQYRRQFDVNLFGVMAVMQAVIPHFSSRKTGVIINISSVLGRVTMPFYSLYHASKWAVEGFSESVKYELETQGITVKLVEPGAVATEFMGRSMDRLVKKGLNQYDAHIQRMEAKSAPFIRYSSKPEAIARVIFKAATDSSSRFRYMAGIDAKFFCFLRYTLGFRIYRKLLKLIVGV